MLELLDRLLGPLARLMVARGVAFPDLAERLKVHYVNAAKVLSDGKITDSRLSVLTGLQRRDIARLRALPAPEQRVPHLARLIALWRAAPDYAGQDLPKSGRSPSFEALAWRVRKDIHPRTMLDTLAAAGAVAVDQNTQTVRLLQSSYQPLAGSDDQLAYLAQNLGDHCDAATDNVLGAEPAHFERAVYYNNLTPAQIDALRALHQAAQMDVLKKLSTAAATMKKENASITPEEASHRFRAGGYFYATKENDA